MIEKCFQLQNSQAFKKVISFSTKFVDRIGSLIFYSNFVNQTSNVNKQFVSAKF